MTNVMMKVPVALRGKMVNALFEATEALGLEKSVVRSQTDGFLVPTEVHKHLFPSSYENEDETPVTTSINDEADIPGAEDSGAEDFDDLTPEEQEALTDPATEK